jgi:hypothetical protein
MHYAYPALPILIDFVPFLNITQRTRNTRSHVIQSVVLIQDRFSFRYSLFLIAGFAILRIMHFNQNQASALTFYPYMWLGKECFRNLEPSRFLKTKPLPKSSPFWILKNQKLIHLCVCTATAVFWTQDEIVCYAVKPKIKGKSSKSG